MCRGGPSLPPEKDPKVEREKAEAEATQAANEKAALARRQKQKQSLLATGGQGATGPVATSTVLAQGKDKFGS